MSLWLTVLLSPPQLGIDSPCFSLILSSITASTLCGSSSLSLLAQQARRLLPSTPQKRRPPLAEHLWKPSAHVEGPEPVCSVLLCREPQCCPTCPSKPRSLCLGGEVGALASPEVHHQLLGFPRIRILTYLQIHTHTHTLNSSPPCHHCALLITGRQAGWLHVKMASSAANLTVGVYNPLLIKPTRQQLSVSPSL